MKMVERYSLSQEVLPEGEKLNLQEEVKFGFTTNLRPSPKKQ